MQSGLGQSGRGRRRGWRSTPGLPKKLLPDLSPQVAAARPAHPKDPCGSGTRLPALLTTGWHQKGRQKSQAGSPPGHPYPPRGTAPDTCADRRPLVPWTPAALRGPRCRNCRMGVTTLAHTG